MKEVYRRIFLASFFCSDKSSRKKERENLLKVLLASFERAQLIWEGNKVKT